MESDGRRAEPEEVDELELESEDDADLESVMRDALEAIEREGRDRGEAEVSEVAAEPELGEAEDSGSAELAVLRREVVELRDRSVRTLADFDNYRKRVERERDEQKRYAGAEILREMLTVIDNLERALEAAGDFESLRNGIALISKQMSDILRSRGVERVKAAGYAFDPKVHDAVSREEDAEVTVPTVKEELLAGYVMKDRLLRPATVIVAIPPQGGDEGNHGTGNGGEQGTT